jgi:uncharacterized membrane protein
MGGELAPVPQRITVEALLAGYAARTEASARAALADGQSEEAA